MASAARTRLDNLVKRSSLPRDDKSILSDMRSVAVTNMMGGGTQIQRDMEKVLKESHNMDADPDTVGEYLWGCVAGKSDINKGNTPTCINGFKFSDTSDCNTRVYTLYAGKLVCVCDKKPVDGKILVFTDDPDFPFCCLHPLFAEKGCVTADVYLRTGTFDYKLLKTVNSTDPVELPRRSDSCDSWWWVLVAIIIVLIVLAIAYCTRSK